MGTKIVVRGGEISVSAIENRPNEYTTGGSLTSLSVYCGEVKEFKLGTPDAVWTVATGCAHRKITAVNIKWLEDAGATIKKNALTGAPNHCLVSGISVEKFVEIFKKNALIFER